MATESQAAERRAGPFDEKADAARLLRFSEAVGAQSTPAGHAAPTFLTVCRKGEFAILAELGIPLARVLHAEQEYIYGDPILAGDTLRYSSRLAKVMEKTGSSGSMSFMHFETEVRARRADGPDVDVGVSRSLIVVKGAAK